jgi:hypothetical protein
MWFSTCVNIDAHNIVYLHFYDNGAEIFRIEITNQLMHNGFLFTDL